MTKIDIISGFLGAGKTTFIKKMIDEAFTGEKIVLIENEFGEVGIDGGFLKDAGIQITEMNSGCICCSLVGDFGKNLNEVITKYHPDRILIEPSGVGKLSDVMKSVIDIEKEQDVKLNALVTVVNALKASKQMKAGSGATTSTAVSYTNGYAPREQMEQALDKFGPWTDFYALGATLYFLLTDQKPPLPSDIDDDMTDDKHEALAMPDSISDRLRRMVLWLMATDRRKRPQSVADIRSILNQKAEKKPADPAKGEEGDDVTIVLPKSDQDKVSDDPAANGETGDASSDSPSAASDDSSTTDNPSAADDETEIVQDDPSVEVEEKKSSKWKWILVVLIFAVIGFFGTKYFLSPGQDTAPATQEPDSTVVDSTVVDSTIVEQQQTPAAQQQTHAATVKTSAASDSAAAYPAPKKKAPKHERPSQKKKSGRQYHYDYDDPYRPSTPSKNPTSGGSSESYGSGSGKNPSYGSSSTSSSKKENTAGDSSW